MTRTSPSTAPRTDPTTITNSTFGFDARGNLTTSSVGSDTVQTSTYGYNSLNQLVTYLAPGSATIVNLTYDPVGRLSIVQAPKKTNFAYIGDFRALETDANGGILRRYVPGPGTDEPIVWYEGSSTADRRWLHADERGSVVAVSDASGAVLANNRYDEYGIPQSGNLGRFQYTGQAWLPEIGMYYYKARMYSPTLGRFMQTDPIGYGDGLNWYNYVKSDPVNATDPSGLDACPPGVGAEICVTAPRPGTGNLPGTGGSSGNGSQYFSTLGVYGSAAPSVFSTIPRWTRTHAEKAPQSGHDYSVYGTICARPLNNAEMRDILSRFSLPGHSGEVATDGNYTVYQWGLPGGRVNVDFADNGLSVRNTTLNPHIFAGQIDRHIYSDRFGTFTTTRGTGTAEFLGGARDWLNGKLGPGIFRRLNEDAAAYAKQKYSGC